MSTVQKYLLKASATIAFASLFSLGTMNEIHAEEMSASNWQPRTVAEIEAEIKAQKQNQNEEDTVEYTFQWGDTLWGISEATDFSIEKLAKVNDINNHSMIEVGTTIYLSGDASILSVENNDEVVSYDVSEDEVVETETPDEVEKEIVEEAEPEAESETEAPEAAPSNEVNTSSSTESETEAAQAAAPAGRTVTVEATAYSRNQASLGNITYSGIDLRENPNVIAVDPSFIPLGSRIYVPGYGEFVAGDTGGAINGNRIDIHMESLDAAWSFGRRTIEVQILD
ncbi:3D domain-containing protein [Marinilactibacillus piezotolerans]|uniref:3D domain-containing protein n=1 Tax=Marinilactibacillus piezotolerans TaxID=258723 RepID=UPI0009B0F24F|nr:3D domain-containing protein [Marinilactibacillus piezotolerans]